VAVGRLKKDRVTTSGNTASRPSNPEIGDTYYDGTLGFLMIYDGSNFIFCNAPAAQPSISVNDVGTGIAYGSAQGSVIITEGQSGGKASGFTVSSTSGGYTSTATSSPVIITVGNNGNYTFTATAYNPFGTSAASSSVTQNLTTVPEQPTIGSATLSGTDTTVTWTLGNNGGKNLTSITITPYIGATAQTPVTAATTSSTSYTFTDLTVGSSYTFKVHTTNANGNSLQSSATNEVTIPSSIFASVMVVAGGGGGGFDEGGGGGAGGFRLLTNQTIYPGTTYNVTIGAGGNGRSSSSGAGNPGSSSSFAGGSISISASGGGSGASGYGTQPAAGGSGGGFRGSAVAGNVGGYNPPEGYAGGINSRGAGGGGGAGGVGQSSYGSDGRGPNGGIGAGGSSYTNYTIINGMGSVTNSGELYESNYYFAGGGGAGSIGGYQYGGGFAGLGGGGMGSNSGNNAAAAGTANTGGGGGGASGWGGSSSGAAGGSGIVILRYSSAHSAASSTTGSPSITTSGGFHYYKFTGNGSITI
jgi:hypothetical protein